MTLRAAKGYDVREAQAFAQKATGYELLPFRVARIPSLPGRVLVTSSVGEYLFLSEIEFADMTRYRLRLGTPLYRALLNRQIICEAGRGPFFAGLQTQHYTRKHLALQDPALHIFVVTLRCDHRCHYCQVSPRRIGEHGFDMCEAAAIAALDRVFESRSPVLTIEFQGGESALAFDRVCDIVERAEARGAKENRTLRFVMTTTLHLLNADMLAFCRDHDIELSTSLDGPAHVHDANRVNKDRDSFNLTLNGIERARAVCGDDRVAALATVTRHSLPFAREIIDTYAALGFGTIALRPLSPFGFAARAHRKLGYTVDEFLAFYREAIEYLVTLNLAGTKLEESYATLLLTRILTPFPTSYVDLQSPAAAGRGVLVYNYDGSVYVSDEGRMLAETGDRRFRMGSVHDPLRELQQSEALQIIDRAGIAELLPGCSTCAYVPFCGADPVFHVATQNDPIGDRNKSEFCARHTGLFQLMFEYLAGQNDDIMRVFLSWITRRPLAEIVRPGYMS